MNKAIITVVPPPRMVNTPWSHINFIGKIFGKATIDTRDQLGSRRFFGICTNTQYRSTKTVEILNRYPEASTTSCHICLPSLFVCQFMLLQIFKRRSTLLPKGIAKKSPVNGQYHPTCSSVYLVVHTRQVSKKAIPSVQKGQRFLHRIDLAVFLVHSSMVSNQTWVGFLVEVVAQNGFHDSHIRSAHEVSREFQHKK